MKRLFIFSSPKDTEPFPEPAGPGKQPTDHHLISRCIQTIQFFPALLPLTRVFKLSKRERPHGLFPTLFISFKIIASAPENTSLPCNNSKTRQICKAILPIPVYCSADGGQLSVGFNSDFYAYFWF